MITPVYPIYKPIYSPYQPRPIVKTIKTATSQSDFGAILNAILTGGKHD